ncbi:MAG: hypothetical protein QM601_02440 [Pseudoxanthomonas sp.]
MDIGAKGLGTLDMPASGSRCLAGLFLGIGGELNWTAAPSRIVGQVGRQFRMHRLPDFLAPVDRTVDVWLAFAGHLRRGGCVAFPLRRGLFEPNFRWLNLSHLIF